MRTSQYMTAASLFRLVELFWLAEVMTSEIAGWIRWALCLDMLVNVS